ncbi:MAG: hypothetical protein LBU06_11890 [Desulfovibrio sp.]|jgi:hypothetical protein|nr:hypothetical protein [Desulfovibrio sp.]
MYYTLTFMEDRCEVWPYAERAEAVAWARALAEDGLETRVAREIHTEQARDVRPLPEGAPCAIQALPARIRPERQEYAAQIPAAGLAQAGYVRR